MTSHKACANYNALFAALSKNYLNPKSELLYKTPFQLLVAVILSAQATDVSVNKVTPNLFKIAPTPEKMILLSENELKDKIKSIGLFNVKARNILKLSQILCKQYDCVVPQDRHALEALPGVGRKTANIILNVIFRQPTLAVDTHIFRLANRTKIAPGKTPLIVEKKLLEVIPKKWLLNAHHLLLLHGRRVCVARRPKCPECCMRQFCRYEKKTLPMQKLRVI
ncbi:MAG: endonuclease III [Gammaproteobacteria bacterium]|jgi:endonuclease-3